MDYLHILIYTGRPSGTLNGWSWEKILEILRRQPLRLRLDMCNRRDSTGWT